MGSEYAWVAGMAQTNVASLLHDDAHHRFPFSLNNFLVVVRSQRIGCRGKALPVLEEKLL